MEEVKEFNYGKLYNFFQSTSRWCKGGLGITYASELGGNCYCLSVAVYELYKGEETIEIRKKLLAKIEEVFPDRTSAFAIKLAQVVEPMVVNKYSLVGFNDHPDTDLNDVIQLCKECRV